MEDKREITDIITDYIEPLLKHDKEKGTELVKTLHVYLQCLGQKNETAQDLHIVRQTLYHRLNKIEQLLGTDYMMPANRFMIEFALHALEFN
jgi:purine catabolism regulator